MNKIYPNYNRLNTGDILLFHWNTKCNTSLNCCLSFYGKLISCFTKSRYTHSAIVIRDPPWRQDLKGLYILESSLETFPKECCTMTLSYLSLEIEINSF